MTDSQPSLAQLAQVYSRRVDLLEARAPGIATPIIEYVDRLRADRNRIAAALAALQDPRPVTVPVEVPVDIVARAAQLVAEQAAARDGDR